MMRQRYKGVVLSKEGAYLNLIGWVDAKNDEECTGMHTNVFKKNANLRAHRYKINDCV